MFDIDVDSYQRNELRAKELCVSLCAEWKEEVEN
jgi:DNA primase catalytic subunit